MKILIIGRPGCSWCRKAKKLARKEKLNYRYADITEERHADLAQWFRTEGFSTVPQIFVDGNHVGGYTEFARVIDARNTD